MKRVYSFDDKATDLLFIAYGDMELKNGEQVAAEFVGRLTLEHTETESPKLKSYNIWGVSVCQFVSRTSPYPQAGLRCIGQSASEKVTSTQSL